MRHYEELSNVIERLILEPEYIIVTKHCLKSYFFSRIVTVTMTSTGYYIKEILLEPFAESLQHKCVPRYDLFIKVMMLPLKVKVSLASSIHTLSSHILICAIQLASPLL